MTADGLRAALLAELTTIRNEWSMKAYGIECTHGDDDPGAKAFRVCVGDLYEIIERHGGNPNAD